MSDAPALAVSAAQPELAGSAEWAEVRREDLCELARRALAVYGQQDAGVTLLEKKTNVTFRVDAPVGGAGGAARYLLRICQPGAYSCEEIQSELTWLLALRRQAELVVPEPVPAGDGSLVTFALRFVEVLPAVPPVGSDILRGQGGRLNRSNKALRTPASDALIDVMNKARLVRFGARKAHIRAAFHARRFFVDTLGFALCHFVRRPFKRQR